MSPDARPRPRLPLPRRSAALGRGAAWRGGARRWRLRCSPWRRRPVARPAGGGRVAGRRRRRAACTAAGDAARWRAGGRPAVGAASGPRRVAHGPVATAADERAAVDAGRHGRRRPADGSPAGTATGCCGAASRSGRAPDRVLVFGDDAWRAGRRRGARSRFTGRLVPADGPGATWPAALLTPRGAAEPWSSRRAWWRAARGPAGVVRDSVAHRPAEPAGAGAGPGGRRRRRGRPPALREDFRTTGLTHLLAVSGTNLTLVVGFLLVLARWVRGARAVAAPSSARPGSSASCCSPAPSRACCGPR